MARVTVEDCIKLIPNRFELVVLAAQRVRDIVAGDPILVKRDNDKNPVIALREIAQELVSPESLMAGLVKSYQPFVAIDDSEEEDVLVTLAEEQDWLLDPESQEMQEELIEDDLFVTDDPDGEELVTDETLVLVDEADEADDADE